MRLKTWPVAALGLGSLVVLIAVSMMASTRKAQDIYGELDRLNSYHQRVDANLPVTSVGCQPLGYFRQGLPFGCCA